MEFKDNVLVRFTPRAKAVFRDVEAAYRDVMGPDCKVVLTSGEDGEHGEDSAHYHADAWDFRHGVHWQPPLMTADQGDDIRRRLAFRLGGEYDVILEPTHLHVEYDPT